MATPSSSAAPLSPENKPKPPLPDLKLDDERLKLALETGVIKYEDAVRQRVAKGGPTLEIERTLFDREELNLVIFQRPPREEVRNFLIDLTQNVLRGRFVVLAKRQVKGTEAASVLSEEFKSLGVPQETMEGELMKAFLDDVQVSCCFMANLLGESPEDEVLFSISRVDHAQQNGSSRGLFQFHINYDRLRLCCSYGGAGGAPPTPTTAAAAAAAASSSSSQPPSAVTTPTAATPHAPSAPSLNAGAANTLPGSHHNSSGNLSTTSSGAPLRPSKLPTTFQYVPNNQLTRSADGTVKFNPHALIEKVVDQQVCLIKGNAYHPESAEGRGLVHRYAKLDANSPSAFYIILNVETVPRRRSLSTGSTPLKRAVLANPKTPSRPLQSASTQQQSQQQQQQAPSPAPQPAFSHPAPPPASAPPQPTAEAARAGASTTSACRSEPRPAHGPPQGAAGPAPTAPPAHTSPMPSDGKQEKEKIGETGGNFSASQSREMVSPSQEEITQEKPPESGGGGGKSENGKDKKEGDPKLCPQAIDG